MPRIDSWKSSQSTMRLHPCEPMANLDYDSFQNGTWKNHEYKKSLRPVPGDTQADHSRFAPASINEQAEKRKQNENAPIRKPFVVHLLLEPSLAGIWKVTHLARTHKRACQVSRGYQGKTPEIIHCPSSLCHGRVRPASPDKLNHVLKISPSRN